MLASGPLVPKFAPEVTAPVCELRNRDTSRLRGNAKMASITVQSHLVLERVLSIEIVRVTERAAVSAARLRGHGKDKASDQAAVDAMRRELNKLPIDGTVVIGEGELDEAPMLFIGEKVGSKNGPKVDNAVDPLEGTTLCPKNMGGAHAQPGRCVHWCGTPRRH